MAAPKMMWAFSHWRLRGSIILIDFDQGQVRVADQLDDEQGVGFAQDFPAVKQRMGQEFFHDLLGAPFA